MMKGMGGPEDSTVSLDSDGIIRITMVGDTTEAIANDVLRRLEEYARRLRSQNKRVLILMDQSRVRTDNERTRAIAADFLKNGDYDRIAIFGLRPEIAQALKYVLNTVSRALQIRSFQDEAHAKRWLRRGRDPLRRKARRSLVFGVGFALLALAWHFVIAPRSFQLPKDFEYSASVISRDNFYDERAAGFKGETVSNTRFGYKADSVKHNVLLVKNFFDVRNTAGEKIISVERTYGVDRNTRQHVPGYGDSDRMGYLFGPVNADKRDFTYWHVNYNAPALMKFQNEENILGLNTYHYTANYHADQTRDLTHLSGVGRTRGVNLDINLQLWIEPTTGYLVKYEDNATAYFYDLKTRERLNPWNQFNNRYSFDSIAAHVQTADELKQEREGNTTSSPIFFGILSAFFFARWLRFLWRSKWGHINGYSAVSRWFTVLFVLGLLLTLTFSSWRQTIVEATKQANIQFQGEAHVTHDMLANALTGYVKALEGARGLFAASVAVDRDEWQAYVERLKLSQYYPGMLGVGFIQSVSSAEKAAHEAQVRSEGFPEYRIRPEGPRAQYGSVMFIEPFNENNQLAFGYDMLSDPVRRVALEAARDSGEPTLSGRVVLIQDSANGDAEKKQYGVLLFAPVYKRDMSLGSVEQRRAALAGYVYTPIRMADFVRSIIGQEASGLNIELFDTTDAESAGTNNRMYVADERYGIEDNYQPEFVRLETLQLGGRTMIIRYASLPSYARDITLQSLPGFILFIGIVLSFLIATIVLLQSSARSRALKLAEKMTNDLRTERNVALTNQHKNEAILSSIGDGVFVIDAAQRIVLFNKAAELISGYTADEVFGRPYKEVLSFSGEGNGKVVEEFITTALSGERAEMALHTMLKRKDGSLVPVADSAAPIINASGVIDGAVVVFRDTTRERQLERMKDEFLSVASHELRTPMGAVRANISMILDGDYGPVPKDLVEPLVDMKTSTVRLVDLVNDLLNVARIEAGRTKFVLVDFALREELRRTVGSLAPLGKEKGIEIAMEGDVDATVQGDTDKITQVLTNLIGNALKFTDEGSITINITVDKDMAEISVTDTGMGISSEDQEKLFTKFKQITSAQKGKPAGTGLGLYISRELIRKMGGELYIKRSGVGQGSVFGFTLPLAGTPTAARVKEAIDREAELHPDQK